MWSTWRWLALLGAVFVSLLLIVTGIGMLLQVRATGSQSVEIQRQPDQVWAVLADVGKLPAWNPQFASVDVITPTMWRAQLLHQPTPVVFQTVESVKPHRLVHRVANPDDTGFGGRLVFEVSPSTAGSRVVMINESEVYNPFQRFLRHIVLGPESLINETLRALRRHLG